MGVPAFDQPLVTQQPPIVEAELTRLVELPEIAVSKTGHEVVLEWAAVPGATAIEVDRATVEIGPIGRSVQGILTTSKQDNGYELTVPAHQRVRSIGLSSLRWVHTVDGESVKTALRNSSDLGSSVRITVSALDPSNQMVTRHALPWVGPRGGVPGQFGGAFLSNSVITIPDMDARRIRIGLVDQSAPEDWQPEDVELAASVTAGIVTVPADVLLQGPDGADLWAFPGDYSDVPVATVGIEPQIRAAFTAALDAGTPLEARLLLRAANEAPIGFRVTGPTGALVRTFNKVPATILEGDPVAPAVVTSGDVPLPNELASSVTTDVTFRYAGIRLLESVSDALPLPADVRGVVVRSEPHQRLLPDSALRDVDVARIGLVGRAPESCELSVQLVDTNRANSPIGPPGVVQLEPHPDIGTVWVPMPALDIGDTRVAISVRTTRGRFFWCTNGNPLTRIAIHDPDPAGRTIRMAGAPVHSLTTDTEQLPGITLPAAAFLSVADAFESELFVTIELADLTLRYAR